MVDPRQQVSSQGIRVLFGFVVVYLLIGAYMYFRLDLPTLAYVAYGVLSWLAGMLLFYRLHRSFIEDLEQEIG